MTAFGILLLLIMGALTLTGDVQIRKTTNTYVEALIDDARSQSTSGIAQWLNTRLTALFIAIVGLAISLVLHDALNRIAESIRSISQMTSQIATAAEEQTSVTEERNASITRIAEKGEEAARAASDNDVYSGEIETIGRDLSQDMSCFRV